MSSTYDTILWLKSESTSRRFPTAVCCLLVATLSMATLAHATTPPPPKNTCEKQFVDLQRNPLYPTTASKIKAFEGSAFLCAGSGLYEAQLAYLYMSPDAQNLSKAKQILDAALKQNLPHRKELLEKQSIMYGLGNDLVHAQEVDRILIHEYPTSYEGYSGLGMSYLMQGRPKESIEMYEKANSLQPTAVAYRNLVIAYAQERRYEAATAAFDQYYRRDHDAFGDRDAAMSVALAYSAQGKLAQADGTLRGLLQAKPQVKEDKDFVELFRKVNQGLQQGK